MLLRREIGKQYGNKKERRKSKAFDGGKTQAMRLAYDARDKKYV